MKKKSSETDRLDIALTETMIKLLRLRLRRLKASKSPS